MTFHVDIEDGCGFGNSTYDNGSQTRRVQDSSGKSARSKLFLWHSIIFYIFFHCIDICEMVKKMVDKTMGTWHKSREWRQTVLRVTVFFIGIFTKECPWKRSKWFILSALNHWVPTFLVFCVKNWNIHVTHFTVYSSTPVWLFELWAKVAGFLCMHHYCCLKEQLLEKLVYSDLIIWQIFPPKWTKRACHFKENNSLYLLPIIKFELSSEKLEFW